MKELMNLYKYKFKKDHTLFCKDDSIYGQSVFFIKSGRVRLTYELKNNKKLQFELTAGSLFGLLEPLAGLDKRVTEAVILENSTIYLWDKESFLLDAGMIAELGIKTIAYLSAFLRTINQKIQEEA